MRKRSGAIVVAAVVAILASASSASAATEVGSDCSAASLAMGNYTMFQTAKDPGSPLPTAAPAAGIVTRWRVNSALPYPIVERLRTFRATGALNEFQVLAESDPEVVQPGQNLFETRVPIDAGNLVGVYAASPLGAAFCGTGNVADAIRVTVADAPVGSTQIFNPAGPIQVAIVAIVEPDADVDGYGDETQDQSRRAPAFRHPVRRSASRPSPWPGEHRSWCSSRPAPKPRSASAAASASEQRKNARKDEPAARGW